MKTPVQKFFKEYGSRTLQVLGVLLMVAGIFPSESLAQSDSSMFGKIEPPPGVRTFQDRVGKDDFGRPNIGMILFLSNVIRLITVAAGIWVLFNIISAGWLYITSPGDSSATEKVSAKITNSIIGLVIVAMAYTVAGLAGYLIFGEAGFILNPELYSAADYSGTSPFDLD